MSVSSDILQGPVNNLVGPLLTDMYQISMTYAYWKGGRADDHAIFDLFFRKCPFKGEFCVFAGLDEAVKLLATFKFKESDIEYLKSIMPHCEPAFFTWLSTLDCSRTKVYAVQEGTLVFPRIPLFRVEGPLCVGQLLETVLLNLVNYPSLVATNAARMRKAAGPEKQLLEFGLRRAQGPDGGLSASKYSYLGGFDGTANVLAGKLAGIPVKGTHAHAFVMSYTGLSDLQSTKLEVPATNGGMWLQCDDFVREVVAIRKEIFHAGVFSANGAKPNDDDTSDTHNRYTNDGELAAFIAYAQAFPHNLLALVDTYDTLRSGVPNFIAVGLALYRTCNIKPVGVRLDSGDLAYLSRCVRQQLRKMDDYLGFSLFAHSNIVASNDINEDVLMSLSREGHEIDTFGIGTNLVTCQKQPALGCVYKLVEINGCPRIKLSQEVEKLIIPGSKSAYRLIGKDGHPLLDIIQAKSEQPPVPGERILCRHPFKENLRAHVTPTSVVPLLSVVWAGHLSDRDGKEEGSGGPHCMNSVALADRRIRCMEQLAQARPDHTRPLNPTPYKVSVSSALYEYMHTLWLDEAPISELA